jgi:hypothetical protein
MSQSKAAITTRVFDFEFSLLVLGDTREQRRQKCRHVQAEYEVKVRRIDECAVKTASGRAGEAEESN